MLLYIVMVLCISTEIVKQHGVSNRQSKNNCRLIYRRGVYCCIIRHLYVIYEKYYHCNAHLWDNGRITVWRCNISWHYQEFYCHLKLTCGYTVTCMMIIVYYQRGCGRIISHYREQDCFSTWMFEDNVTLEGLFFNLNMDVRGSYHIMRIIIASQSGYLKIIEYCENHHSFCDIASHSGCVQIM